MAKKSPGKPPSQRGNRRQFIPKERTNINDVRFIAAHEAGHAVGAILLGVHLKGVDIIERQAKGQMAVGFADTKGLECASERYDREHNENLALTAIVLAFMGPAAEYIINPGAWKHGTADDDRLAARTASSCVFCKMVDQGNGIKRISPKEQEKFKQEIEALEMKGLELAAKLIAINQISIDKVAELLLERKSLTGEEVAEIVKQSAALTV